MTAIKFNSHTKAVITTRRPLQLKLKISFHFDWKIYMLLNVLESLEVSRATRLMAMLMCHCDTRGVPGRGTIRQRKWGGGVVNCLLHVIHGKSGALRTDASCNCRRARSSLINRIRLQFCAAHFTLSLIMPLSQSVAQRDRGAQHDENCRRICWPALWPGCKCTPRGAIEVQRAEYFACN